MLVTGYVDIIRAKEEKLGYSVCLSIITTFILDILAIIIIGVIVGMSVYSNQTISNTSHSTYSTGI